MTRIASFCTLYSFSRFVRAIASMCVCVCVCVRACVRAKRFILVLPPMQIRQKVEQIKAYFSAVENPHNPLHEAVKDTKRRRLGRGKSWMGQAEDSILQVCQLTELKQTTEWERYPNRFRRLYETLLPENLGKYCREWPAGKPESEIKLLIQENSKPQDLIVYTDDSVTKDQSGWGFTDKQGATTIHKNSAANLQLDNGSRSSHHALRWIASRGDSQTTHVIILTDSMSLLQKVKSGIAGISGPDWNVDGRHPPSKTPVGVLPWTCRSEGKRPNR